MFPIDHRLLMALAIALVARREFFIRQRSHDEYAAIDIYALIEITIVGLTFVVILFRTQIARTAKAMLNTSLFWVFAFLMFSIFVAPLSANMMYSLFFTGEYLSQVIVIFCVIASSKTHEEAIKRLVTMAIIVTVITFAFKLFLYGFSSTLYNYKSNGAGACGAMLAVFSFVCLISENNLKSCRNVLIAGTIAGIGVVAITTSAASIVSTLLGIAIASLIGGKGKAPLVLLIFAIGLVGFLYPDKEIEVLFPGKDIAQIESLHGRTRFWDDALTMLNNKPIAGHGYGMAAKVGNVHGTNLHNSSLSILLGSGVGGFLLFAIGIFRLCKESAFIKSRHVPGAAAAFAAVVAGLLNSNTISFIGEDWRSASFVFISLWALIAFSALQLRTIGEPNLHRGPIN